MIQQNHINIFKFYIMAKKAAEKVDATKAGRTFLTKEEMAQRDELLANAKKLEEGFYHLGQIATSFFLKLDETKSGALFVSEAEKNFKGELIEKYGEVNITEEGEVLPIPTQTEE